MQNLNIIVDHIKPGLAHRPNTNPSSSLYNKIIEPEWIVYHNPAAAGWDAKRLHDYGKTQYIRPNLKSWNYSVDKERIYEMVPVGEATWQAGDNLGQGNTNSISMEVCDRGMYLSPPSPSLFWDDQHNAARLCAKLIKEVPSLRPFPECMTQHNRWSGKNCPYWVRRESGGWQRLLGMVEEYLEILDDSNKEYEYIVISGSYTNLNNAMAQNRNLADKGFPSTIFPVNINGVTFYRVVVGIYQSQSEAGFVVTLLRNNGFSANVIEEEKDSMPVPIPEPEPEPVPEPELSPWMKHILDNKQVFIDLGKLLEQ